MKYSLELFLIGLVCSAFIYACFIIAIELSTLQPALDAILK